MDITKHAKQRYVERILDITKENETKAYMNTHDEEITKAIKKLLEKSTLIFKGAISALKQTQEYYLKDNICIVCDNNSIRTIYLLNFAFPEEVTKVVIDGLIKEIKTLEEKIKEENETIKVVDMSVNQENNLLNLKIKALQDEIEMYQNEIKHNEMKKTLARNTVKVLSKNLQIYAEQLLSNNQYKKDIEKI